MTGRLRVGMNLLWLRPGVVGGTEPAATSTLSALARHAADRLELRAYAQPEFCTAHPGLAAAVPTRTFPVPGGSPVPRVAVESTWLPFAVRRDHLDVVHCYGGVVTPGLARPVVLTVHDVQPLEPGAAFSPVKKRWLATMLPRSVAKAQQIAVPSGFVRDRLVDRCQVDPGRITVVPHGVEPDPVDRDAPPGPAVDPAVLRARFDLPGPYVLYPAITYPHKNHRRLVEAFARTGPGTRLVLAGGTGAAETDLAVAVERAGVGDRVRRVGRVSDAELAALMAGASVMAFPSRYEGFGLPVLEALAGDVPIVASRAAALPEIVGDAGILVDPDDTDGWADALTDALAGAYTGPEWTARRRNRLRRFDWAHQVPLLVELYRRAARERRGTR